MAGSSFGVPPLLVRTVRDAHRLEGGTDYRIGRDPRSDIGLSDARVSWDHAVLRAEGTGWVLADQGSRNGIYLGAERVSRLEITGPCVVHFGDPQDGPVLRFELQQPSPSPLPSADGWAGHGEAGHGWGDRGNEASQTFIPGVDREPTSRIQLRSKVVRIGRRPDNDVVLSDLGVSKVHAELRMSPAGRYTIVDLGSHNGTFVNGIRVNQAELTETDIVSIGHATFRLVGGELREFIDDGNVSFEAHDLMVRVPDSSKPDKHKVILEGITFPLPERSMMAVIGPAGAGKSTLLNALTGKQPATTGTVLYDYRDLYDSYDELKHRIGLVPQQSVTHDQLTARSALGYAAELRFPPDASEAERSQRVSDVLAELDMTEHAETRIDHLSGGQAKRVNIGLELLTKPSLLFLDEPTSPLDPHLKRELFLQMRAMADRDAAGGQSVVVITHDVESKLIDQCDRLIVLVPGGRMAYFGPPKEGLKYFGQEDWADVFAQFAIDPRRDWAGEFRNSPEFARYVATPMATRSRQPLPERRRDEDAGRRQRGRITQVFTMARRYARVMSVDRGYLMLAVLLPVVLGLLVRVIPAAEGLGGPPHTNAGVVLVLLIMVMSACLVGTANSIGEFIKERGIYERERMTGLSPGAYLGSKVVVLGVISVVQAVAIVFIGLFMRKMPSHSALIPGPPVIEITLAVSTLCVVSMFLGLMVSTLVSRADQTMLALVMVTMMQVVFSGGVFPLTGALRYVSYIAPARWGMAALGSTINLNRIGVGITADGVWAHSADQWLVNMAWPVAIGLIALVVARVRLGAIGPRRRR